MLIGTFVFFVVHEGRRGCGGFGTRDRIKLKGGWFVRLTMRNRRTREFAFVSLEVNPLPS